MRVLLIVSALAATAWSPPGLAGQTTDQSRLIFTVGLGQTSGGGTLWRIPRQPIAPADTLDVNRHFRRSLSVVFSGTYFPGDHFGINIEAHLIGLGTTDGCSVVGVANDSANVEVCNSIDGSKRSATSVAFSVGGMYRIASHQPIHPYLRGNVGMVISQQSFIKTYGESVDPATGSVALIPLYYDHRSTSVSPYISLGGGMVVTPIRGYQLHFELRDNWVSLPAISGPGGLGTEPPNDRVGKHLLSFIVGFDVVLERRRGRRY
jgi:hypothetical protein